MAKYLRLIDSRITQLKAQGPSRTCNERKEEEEEVPPPPHTIVNVISEEDRIREVSTCGLFTKTLLARCVVTALASRTETESVQIYAMLSLDFIPKIAYSQLSSTLQA